MPGSRCWRAIGRIIAPYRESDPVLNVAYHALCGGQTLSDIELWRHDEAFLDALGADAIPGASTAGDFCRRFDEAFLDALGGDAGRDRPDVARPSRAKLA